MWGPSVTLPGTPWNEGTPGVANGLVDVSPAGGFFVALDGDAGINGYLRQTINGLTPGGDFKVEFWWAAGQARLARGATTSSLQVSLGNQVQSTVVHNIADQGFEGWQKVSMRFNAANSTDTLSFLSVGTPAGLPPMVFLDGISVNAVPEPSSWAMLIAGFGIIGAAARRKRLATAASGLVND